VFHLGQVAAYLDDETVREGAIEAALARPLQTLGERRRPRRLHRRHAAAAHPVPGQRRRGGAHPVGEEPQHEPARGRRVPQALARPSSRSPSWCDPPPGEGTHCGARTAVHASLREAAVRPVEIQYASGIIETRCFLIGGRNRGPPKPLERCSVHRSSGGRTVPGAERTPSQHWAADSGRAPLPVAHSQLTRLAFRPVTCWSAATTAAALAVRPARRSTAAIPSS
jgi:hypothetical protein